MTRRILFSLMLVAILVAGCAPVPTSTPGPTATPAPPQPVEVRPGGFAAYAPVKVDVVPAAPAYTPDLNAVANSGVVSWLTEAQRAALETNGFIVVPQGYAQVYQIY